MAERHRGRNTHTNTESVEERIAPIVQMIETLDYPELLRLSEIIDAEYHKKAESAKVKVIAEAREKFDQLGLTFAEVAEQQQKRKRVTRNPTTPKYRSPDGKEWSGRGATPKWIREHEESGGERKDYLIKAEG